MGTLGDLCVANLIHVQAGRQPNAVAITAPGRTPLTYGALRDRVQEVVAAVNAMGIGRNDRVAMVMPQGPEMAVGFLAIAAGATAAPLNPAYRSREFDSHLSDMNAAALAISTDLDSAARDVARTRNIPIIELAAMRDAPAGLFELAGETGLLRPRTGGTASAGDIALVLQTSGTTSRSKVVPLTHQNICQSALNISTSLGITKDDCCLSVMPLFHVHGLIGALLSSLAAGASVICAPGFSTPGFFQWMKTGRPTWYTAVPAMHQAILSDARSNREVTDFHSLRFIRSCSTALSPRVMEELESVFNVPVVEAYGMTEAAHEMTCNPLPPGERKAGSVGLPTGPKVAIMDEGENLLPRGEEGEIVVKGPTVVAEYENRPRADEKAFSSGWLKTGDEGYFDEDGYLFITGRIKETINRGGEKISPREVDEVLLDHPAVAQAVVFAVPHSELGEDVGAAIVLREGVAATSMELQVHASKQLADFKVPRRVIFVDEIPKGPTGKPVRIGLAELLDVPAPGRVDRREQTEYAAPRTSLEETLAPIWTQAFGMERVGVHDNFFELGGNSLQLAQIISRVWELFHVSLPPQTLFEAPTIAALAEKVEAMGRVERPVAKDESGCLVPLRGGRGRPFFLVPGGGGGVQELIIYGKLIHLLDTDHRVYGLRARGLDGEHPPHANVETMAADYVDEVRGLQPDGPYLLGGECIGGGVAFEMARQLRAQGRQVALLVLMNAFLPGPNRDPRQTYLARQIRRVEHHARHLRTLPAGRRLGHVARSLHNLQRRMLPLTREQRAEHHIYRVRANYQSMLTRHRPRSKYPGRLTLLVTADDYRADSFREWKELTTGGMVIDKVPGTHESYLGEHAKTTAAQLGRHLKAC